MCFAEVWKQDLGDQFQIEPSTQGVQNVHLKCGSNSMIVKLETDQEFTGVMYTKGNFYDQSEPCFASTKQKRGSRNLSMRFTFEQCNTKYDGNVFSNTVVVQNDPGEKDQWLKKFNYCILHKKEIACWIPRSYF